MRSLVSLTRFRKSNARKSPTGLVSVDVVGIKVCEARDALAIEGGMPFFFANKQGKRSHFTLCKTMTSQQDQSTHSLFQTEDCWCVQRLLQV
jgi:hypothetical protein